MLRINKFNIGEDPVSQLDNRIESFLDGINADVLTLTRETTETTERVMSGELKLCKKCGKHKPLSHFKNSNTRSGTTRLCKSCKRTSDAKRQAWQSRRWR